MEIRTLIMALIVAGVVFIAIIGLFAPSGLHQGAAGLRDRQRSSQPQVHFTGALVYPVIYKKEFMKIP